MTDTRQVLELIDHLAMSLEADEYLSFLIELRDEIGMKVSAAEADARE